VIVWSRTAPGGGLTAWPLKRKNKLLLRYVSLLQKDFQGKVYLNSKYPRIDPLLHNNHGNLRRIVISKAASQLLHLMLGHNQQLAFRHSIAINKDLLRQEAVGLLVLLQRLHERDLKRVGQLLSNHLKAHFRVPARLVVVQRRHEPNNRLVLLLRLMVHINADYHALLDRDRQPPQLPAQLHIHLQDDLLRHRLQHIVRLVNSLQDYHLRRHRTLDAAQSLHSRVPTVADHVEDNHDHLHVLVQVLLDLVHVRVRPVVAQRHGLGHVQTDARAATAVHRQHAELLDDLLLLGRVDDQPVLDVNRFDDLFVARWPSPVALVVGFHFALGEYDLLAGKYATLDLFNRQI